MRDIRQDLRERLAVLNGRHLDQETQYQEARDALENAYRDAVAALVREKVAVQQLLAIEEERVRMPAGTVDTRKTAHLISLADFLVTKVHAHGPMNKGQLRAEADLAGYFAAGNGRTFHITLMNITKSGRVTVTQDGRYEFARRQPPTFGGEQQSTEDERQILM